MVTKLILPFIDFIYWITHTFVEEDEGGKEEEEKKIGKHKSHNEGTHNIVVRQERSKVPSSPGYTKKENKGVKLGSVTKLKNKKERQFDF